MFSLVTAEVFCQLSHALAVLEAKLTSHDSMTTRSRLLDAPLPFFRLVTMSEHVAVSVH